MCIDDDVEHPDLVEAVNKLLDEVQRPVGSLEPRLPDTPAARRALLGLYDAANRNL